MIVLSSSEFRARQKHYIGMAMNGADVLVTTPNLGTIRLMPVTDSDVVVDRGVIDELKTAFADIRRHLGGRKQLPNLQNLIDEL